MFTKEEVAYIGDLAHDFAFEDYCEDEEEMQMMDEIKRAAYSCTSECEWVRVPSRDYSDFSLLVSKEQFNLFFRCMTYRVKRCSHKMESDILHKLSSFCVFRPVFNKEEFLKLWQAVQELTVRLKRLEW
jgi:hypothetical protein